MRAVLYSQVLIGSITLAIILLAAGRQAVRQHRFVALFFLFYFADNLVLALASRFSGAQLIPDHLWEGFLVCGWSGKTYSILTALLLLYLFRSFLPGREVGITHRQNRGWLVPSAGILLAIVLWSLYSGSRSPRGEFDIQALAYLALMPGLNEELVYRGILPACLARLFPPPSNGVPAGIGWSTAIPTLLFGLLHGLWLDGQLRLHLEAVWIRNALASGFAFAWLKERTGSLLLPMLAHGAWDVLLFLPRMV